MNNVYGLNPLITIINPERIYQIDDKETAICAHSLWLTKYFRELYDSQLENIRKSNEYGLYLVEEESENYETAKVSWLSKTAVKQLEDIYLRGKLIGLINVLDPTNTVIVFFTGLNEIAMIYSINIKNDTTE